MGIKQIVKTFLNKIGVNIPEKWINKFTITGVVFLFWLAFIDSYSLVERYQLSRTIHRLENEKQGYIEAIDKAIDDKQDLDKNKEKFAREKYYMHKQNEEIFIIEPKKE